MHLQRLTRRFRRVIFLAGYVLGFGSSRLLAGPPFFTDDPDPVDYHHGEAYMASQYWRTESEGYGTVPQMEANYGAYPNLQLHVIAPAQFDRPSGGPTMYGYGDTELGAKYRFIQESSDRPQVGIFPLVELPTGDASRNLGNGKAQIYTPLWIQKSWGPWTTYGGGGFWYNANRRMGNGDFEGWLLQRDLSKALTLGVEIFHRDGNTVDGPTGTGFNAGGQINFGEHEHLLFSAGRDFSNVNLLTDYLAWQWTY